MMDSDFPGGDRIEVPNPVEIPPTQDPIGIPVPHDVPASDSLPPRVTGVPFTDPVPERSDPLMP